MVRAPFIDMNGLKKGAWSPQEDDKLRAFIEKHGHGNWRELPMFAGLERCGKSCRLRWMNYLRPGVKHGNYAKKEDDLIILLHKQFGNKWSRIAAELPGRSDNEIKNRWHSHLKKRAKQSQRASVSNKEFEEQSNKTFKCVIVSENRDLKVDESFVQNTQSLPILESSPLSPELSSSEISQSTSDNSTVVILSNTSKSLNWISEDSNSLFGTFENISGDFWTQPFVADQDGCRFLTPEVEFVSRQFLNYDDNIDLFYQLMQELRAN